MPEVPVNIHNHMGVDLQLHPESVEPPICWEAVFGNTHPIEVEIGSGRGRFLYEAASRLPGTNFLGIEHWKKRWVYTLGRLTKHGLTNARIVGLNAIDFVETMVAPESVHAFHIYFPDPWPKRRHQKRRIFSPNFIDVLALRLLQGGHIHVATDYQEYAEHIQPMLDGCQRLERIVPAPEPIARTSFEIKYLQEGRTIYRYTYRRTT